MIDLSIRVLDGSVFFLVPFYHRVGFRDITRLKQLSDQSGFPDDNAGRADLLASLIDFQIRSGVAGISMSRTP